MWEGLLWEKDILIVFWMKYFVVLSIRNEYCYWGFLVFLRNVIVRKKWENLFEMDFMYMVIFMCELIGLCIFEGR